MRLVNTLLSEHELKKEDIEVICNIFKKQYDENIEVNSYKYDDRKYYETDFDIIDVEFLKENIYIEIDKLIKIHEKIIQLVNQNVEIIVANDDTDTEIQIFEKNCNDISGFGLFITSRKILELEPYYTSDICNAYLNFENVSFGVMFE
ncbi:MULTISPECIES: hypothetical protein [Priestia]|uniref:Uncharacterized protein n=2 Tax=Priestia megaterium TaxID=1404 RepID=A0A806U0P2_PRIMG|nr:MULTISPECIES: hypothetical protein [Priestia]MBU8852435.1 hypothetical protein [Bacillus sp. FJAT-26377]MCL9635066.1 hypothetical protein [Bacillus zanthoxyli]NHH92996.1 hypothetical protein [Bacillus sp. MB95]AKP77816.1 hypothetical protein AS52_02855 [Priestia megaterium Q3]MBY0062378.1 hypothetical protein [Priestia aryabhattai]